jgi:ribose transport system permease protein
MSRSAVAPPDGTESLLATLTPSDRATRLVRRPLLVRWAASYRIELTMLVVLAVLVVALQLATGDELKGGNVANVLQAAAPLVLISLGQLLVMSTAGIDLSVGSVFSLSGIAGAAIMNKHGVTEGVVVALAVGAACGAVNGFLVTRAKLAPFIVTLAMFSAAASLAFVVTNGASQVVPVSFGGLDAGHLIPGVANYVLIIFLAVAVFQLILTRTIFGRWLYASGSNESAARLVGVPTDRVKFSAYVISGLLAACAALLTASYLGTVEAIAGNGLELQSIAAVVIGGASLFGGTGTAIGALIGVLITSVIQNGINLLGINSFWRGTVTGAVIVLAVLVERATRSDGGRVLVRRLRRRPTAD